MTATKRITLAILTTAVLLLTLSGCRVSYSFSNASISANLRTANVVYFNNTATMISPILAPKFNEELVKKIQRETPLQIVRDGGDIVLEGEIIDYRSTPTAVTADQMASMNRLTIAVKVRITNYADKLEPVEKTFSEFAEYPSDQMLTDAEGTLIPVIVEKLVQNIFNEAFSNW